MTSAPRWVRSVVGARVTPRVSGTIVSVEALSGSGRGAEAAPVIVGGVSAKVEVIEVVQSIVVIVDVALIDQTLIGPALELGTEAAESSEVARVPELG